jgi:N-acetylglucosamine-6-phosphate deacetylase
MVASYQIHHARIPAQQGLQTVVVQADRIVAMGPEIPPDRSMVQVDLQGDYLSLGGIDLQINGALGLPFPEITVETVHQLNDIGQYLWQQGVDGYCPTLVTTSIANIQRSLQLISQFQPQSPDRTAQILGVHLEGPCLNPAKRGAHPAEFLQSLTVDTLKTILGDWADQVRIITLAPELDPTGTVIPYLKSLGITVSLGHSQATAAQATAAFAQGATMVTHAFNAMPSLHHREPGLLGAAIVQPQVQCGFIADGQHVAPMMLDILLKASNYDQGLFLVSDALSPLGLPDGRYPWDSRHITVTQGTARLDDGTLSGTTLPLLEGVKNLVNWGICTIDAAISLATTAPRQAIGLPTGWLQQPAQLLRWQTGDRQTIDRQLTYQRLTVDASTSQ